MDIGKDCWDIIDEYKGQLEHRDKFKSVLFDINNLKSYSKRRSNTIRDILKKPLWLKVHSIIISTRLVFNCEYVGIHNVSQALEEFYENGNCYYRY